MIGDISESRTKLPKMAIAAVAVAATVGAVSLALALVSPASVFSAPLPIAAGITILRRRTWGGYGFALVAVSQIVTASLLLKDNSFGAKAQVWFALFFQAALGLLFLFAGRALSRAGAKAGARWPWIALALALTVPPLFVRAYVMPSGSMENTLLIGDRMLVRVFPRPDPKRSDVVVFHYPLDHRQIFVKRVIGMPGDRINMKDRVVYLNGVALREPYVVRRFPADVNRDNLPPPDSGEVGMDPRLNAARTEMLQKHIVNGEVVVPVGNYFVLGDNRDDSLDSRYWGFVKKSELIGEPFLIYDSEATSDEDLQTGNVRSGRTRTRWSRVFKIL